MSRQSGFESQDSGWRDLVWAGGAAALVTLVLVAGVALAWVVGSGPGNTPALTAPEPPTPTPRALSFNRATPTPAAPTATAVIAVDTAEPEKATEPPKKATPPPEEKAATEEPPDEEDATFTASTEAEFLALASGSWTASGDTLSNDGSEAVSERWLALSPMPKPNFAVEAEIRVSETLGTVCDQSFGLTGGSPVSGLVFGGGVIFPCSGGDPLARLTNVSQWEDGYNADAVFAENAFTPGKKWRTYRFELRDGQMRLLVDGGEIVSAVADPGIDPQASDVETGIWTQGVGLEVRQVTVSPLPE